MRYSNIQESFFDFLKFIDEKEEKRIIARVEEFMNTNPDFTYDLEFNLPGLCPIERIAQSLAINEGKLRKVLKKVAKATDAIGIAKISSKVWSGDVLVTLNVGSGVRFKSSRGGSSYKRTYRGDSVYDSREYVNESFLSSLKKAFGFGTSVEKEELDNAALEVVKFLYDRPVYDYHKKSDTPGLIFVSLLSEKKYTDVPFKTLEELFKSDTLDNCDVVNFKYKDIEGPVVVFGKPSISRKEYLVDNTSDFQEMLLIQEIQRKLISKGFLTEYTGSRSVVTGETNSRTITAIIAFQDKYKIPTTKRGEINIETLRRLGVNLSFLGIDLKIDDTPLIDKLKKEASSTNTPIPPPPSDSFLGKAEDIFAPTDSDDFSYSDEYSDDEEVVDGEEEYKDVEKEYKNPTQSRITQKEASSIITGENNELVNMLIDDYKAFETCVGFIGRGKTETSKIITDIIGENSNLPDKEKRRVFEELLKFILKKDGVFFTNVNGFEKFNTNDLKSISKNEFTNLIVYVANLINNIIPYIKGERATEISKAIKDEIQKIHPTSERSSEEIKRMIMSSGKTTPEPEPVPTSTFQSEIISDEDLESEEDEKKTEDLTDDTNKNIQTTLDLDEHVAQRERLVSTLMDESGFNFFNTYMNVTQDKFKGSFEKPDIFYDIQKIRKSSYGTKISQQEKKQLFRNFLQFLLKKDGLFFTYSKAPFANKFKDLGNIELFKPNDYRNLISALIAFINRPDDSISAQMIEKLNSLYAEYSN